MKVSEFIRKALSEDNGNPSSMRTMVFAVTVQFSAVLVFGFVYIIIDGKHPELILPYATLLIGEILGALGIKAWQKDKEENVVTPPGEKPGDQGAAPQ